MRHESIHRRTVLRTLGAGLGGLTLAAGTATASGHVETLFSYDPAENELPENVAVDPRGTKYVSFPPRGEIRTVTPDNEGESSLATFDVGDGNGVIGLEVAPSGTLYACLVTFGTGDTHGIWEVGRDGDAELFAPLPTETFPNDILLDDDALLVTDTIGGAVLRVERGSWSTWVADPLLEGTGAFGFPFPIGANGIAEGSDGTVYVAVTERDHVVEIPRNPDGSAGTPSVLTAHPSLFAADGLAVDVHDAIYAATIGQNAVVRVSQDGSVETLATAADGLDNPSDVTFGRARGNQRSLYVTNFALLSQANPSLALLDVGVPGRPIHP